MKISRRRLVLIVGLVVLVAVAALVGLALARGGTDRPSLAGRIAVRDGCGLTHMWPDGTDQRSMCLSGIWAAASLSWNGEKLAWDTNGGVGLWTASADGSNPVAVPVVPGVNFDPSLSPDADKVAFLHSARDDGRYDLWVGSTWINNAEQLTASQDVSTVAWSPAGGWIAYVQAWSETTLEGEVFLIRPNGEDETLLTRGDSPTWAPDGSRLAFVHAGSIWTIGADGSEARMLIRNGESPAWSRDGDVIAFMREVPCGEPVCELRVFIVPATGGTARAIGPTFAGPRALVWLPDPNE